jgi:copper oxidase (laccase) domain-containing protein
VSEELAADFARRFGPLARPRHLDLAAANAALLAEAGFAAPEILRHCTICERTASGAFRFHSYRRDASTARQRSQILKV